MSDQEPIDTTMPWARTRREPLTQVEAERAAYRAMTEAGNGKVHPMSVVSPGYEPTRAMAPARDSRDIIAKKGLQPPKKMWYKPVDIWDKVVTYTATACAVGIVGIIVYLFVKLG